MLVLRKEGFVPDVILAHPGWGETLYAKDVFPLTPGSSICASGSTAPRVRTSGSIQVS